MSAAERALLFAAFSGALGFGMLLPLLPLYLSASGDMAAWHMGVLPVVFLAAAAASAPLWGRLSDRAPRVHVLIAGLAASAAAMVPFLLEHSIATLYAYQAIAGIGFGAAGPVALAMLYEAGPAHARGRAVARFGGATLAGYLVGPAVGGWIASLASAPPAHRTVALALAVQAAAATAALVLVAASCRRSPSSTSPGAHEANASDAWAAIGAALLVAFVVGGFEVATSLYVRSPLHFGPREVATLFTACSAAMIAAQLVVLPRLPAHVSRVALAFRCVAGSGVLLAVMALVQAHGALLAIAAAQGACLGLAAGLLSFEAAAVAGRRRGSALGYQNAAINAGQAVGSAAGAAAFSTLGVAAFPALGAAIVLAGAFACTSRRGTR